MRKILNAARLPFVLIAIIRNLQIQKKFLAKHISPILDEAIKNNDGTLSTRDTQKILRYYGLAVPAILSEAFCILRSGPLTGKERWVSTCQGAMTGLFDDFFDEAHLDETEIKSKLDINTNDDTLPTNEKLFSIFYAKALKLSPHPHTIINSLAKVHESQVESKLQASGGLSKEETMRITLSKGGNSLLFYRTAINNEMKGNEEEILFRLGGLMQLANDLFDIYKDREAGIKTPFMFITDIADVKNYFSMELQTIYRDAYSMPYPASKIRAFLSILSMGVFSRCFVCFRQLEKAQSSIDKIFSPGKYTRSQLICDMDTKKNMLQSAAYHIKYFL